MPSSLNYFWASFFVLSNLFIKDPFFFFLTLFKLLATQNEFLKQTSAPLSSVIFVLFPHFNDFLTEVRPVAEIKFGSNLRVFFYVFFAGVLKNKIKKSIERVTEKRKMADVGHSCQQPSELVWVRGSSCGLTLERRAPADHPAGSLIPLATLRWTY